MMSSPNLMNEEPNLFSTILKRSINDEPVPTPSSGWEMPEKWAMASIRTPIARRIVEGLYFLMTR